MSTATSLACYRAAAVRLREAAEWNRFDTEFQGDQDDDRDPEERGLLVPLVDANTVKFFMDPDHETHMVDSFASLREVPGGDRAQRGVGASDHMRTFARITAEFMFLSSPVRIGGEEGQLWHEPPLLAPAHADEVAAMLRRIEGRAAKIYEVAARRTEAEALEVPGLGRDATMRITALNDAGPGVGEDRQGLGRVKELVHGVSSSLERLFVSPGERRAIEDDGDRASDAAQVATAIEEAIRWLRLMRQDKLRPLVSHPLCDADILNPPDDEIRRLAKPLAAYKQPGARNRGEPSTRVLELAWNDATAVVQAARLNARAHRGGKGSGKRLRFILISGDDALHAVYANQFWARDAGKPRPDPSNYVLRRPLQYIPVMNARSIPNGYRATELFDLFLSVLNSVTDFITERSHHAFALEHDWRKAQRPTATFTDLDMRALYRLSDLWTEATTASNTLCAGLAVHDFGLKELFSTLDRFAGNERARAPLIQFHQQIFVSIDGTQLPLVAQELLAEAVGGMRRWKAMGMAGVRMPVLLRERFEAVTRSIPLEAFVAQLANGKRKVDAVTLQQAMASGWHRYKVLFFAGAIAAIADNFDRAARHLKHADQLLKKRILTRPGDLEKLRDDEREINYLQSVIDRLRMRDAKTFREAAQRLATLAAEAPAGSFEQARAMSEAASLHLMRYFNIRFGVELEAAPGTMAEMCLKAAHLLATAEALLPRLRKRKSVDSALLTGLQVQVYANMACWHVVGTGFFDGRDVRLDADAAESLDTLTSLRSLLPGDDYIVDLWDGVATWLSAPPSTRASIAAEVAKVCRKRLEGLAAVGVGYPTPVDAVVFRFIAERAEACAAGCPVGGPAS